MLLNPQGEAHLEEFHPSPGVYVPSSSFTHSRMVKMSCFEPPSLYTNDCIVGKGCDARRMCNCDSETQQEERVLQEESRYG